VARRFFIIHNPVAGRRRHWLLAETVQELSARGCLVTVQVTQRSGDAIALAREASDADVVLAAGGDGTVGEVVHGLMTRPDGDTPDFATIPLGTINVLALETGLPKTPAQLAGVLAEGPASQLTVGRANGRYFLLTAGAGTDAAAVGFLSPTLKKFLGQGAYYIALVQALIREGNTVYDVVLDAGEGEQTFTVSSVIVTNASRYGGPKVIAPEARLDDGKLHVLLGMSHGRWNLTRYALAYMRGKLFTLPDVRIVPVTKLRVAAPAGKPVQFDGDVVLSLPIDIEVAPQRLGVIVPR
jgi:YegS/Rv2252/BmrU family lipid kinase